MDGGFVALFAILGVECAAVACLVTYLLYRRQPPPPKGSKLKPGGKVATTYGDPNDSNGHVLINVDDKLPNNVPPTNDSSASSSPDPKKKLLDSDSDTKITIEPSAPPVSEDDAPPYSPPPTVIKMDKSAYEEEIVPISMNPHEEVPIAMPRKPTDIADHLAKDVDSPVSSRSESPQVLVQEDVVNPVTARHHEEFVPSRPLTPSEEPTQGELHDVEEAHHEESIPPPIPPRDLSSSSLSSESTDKDLAPHKESSPRDDVFISSVVTETHTQQSRLSSSTSSEILLVKKSDQSSFEEVEILEDGPVALTSGDDNTVVDKRRNRVRRRVIKNKEIIEYIEEENIVIKKHKKVSNVTREESSSSSSSEEEKEAKKPKKKKKKKMKRKKIQVSESSSSASESSSSEEEEVTDDEREKAGKTWKHMEVQANMSSSTTDEDVEVDGAEKQMKIFKSMKVQTKRPPKKSKSKSKVQQTEVVQASLSKEMQTLSLTSSSVSTSDDEEVNKELEKVWLNKEVQATRSSSEDEKKKRVEKSEMTVSKEMILTRSPLMSPTFYNEVFFSGQASKSMIDKEIQASRSSSSDSEHAKKTFVTVAAHRHEETKFSSEYHYDITSHEQNQSEVTTTIIERTLSPTRDVTHHRVYRELRNEGDSVQRSQTSTLERNISDFRNAFENYEVQIDRRQIESIGIQTEEQESSSDSESEKEEEIVAFNVTEQQTSLATIQKDLETEIEVQPEERHLSSVSTVLTKESADEESNDDDKKNLRKEIYFTSGWKKQVSLDDLLKAGVVTETTAQELEQGLIDQSEVELTLKQYLVGNDPIAGLLVEETGQKMSIYDAFKQGLIRRGTAISLLEAQAATGRIIDPKTANRMSVREARDDKIIDRQFEAVLARAEKAVLGYKARGSDQPLSLFEAMNRGIVVQNHGIRLLEAQIATGGIIDPKANHRLPVEVAYERGLFDENLHEILEDPSDDTRGFFDPNTEENLTYLELMERCVMDKDTELLLLPLKQKEAEKVVLPVEETIVTASAPVVQAETVTDSRNTALELQEAREVLAEKVEAAETKQESSSTTLITTEEVTVTTNEKRRKSRKDIHFLSGWKRRVTLEDLFQAGVVSQSTIEKLEEGQIEESEVEQSLEKYLVGAQPIAGLLMSDNGEKMSIYNAWKKGMIRRGTSISLLEAQAATGRIIDPKTGERFSVSEACQKRLIDRQFEAVLTRAERAVYGYKTRLSRETISLFEAMTRGLVVENHGVRLLEAQIATGGIIDPKANHRLPVEVAFERGLFDERLHRILEDPTDDTRGFFDPNTEENLTYLELMERCVFDKDTGLRLLPMRLTKKRVALKHSKVVFESATKRQVLLQDILAADLLDNTTAQRFDEGQMTTEEVKEMVAKLKVYVDGTMPVAGIISSITGEKISILEASRGALIRKGTAFELLEAQAACGKIIDVQTGRTVSVDTAIRIGVIDSEFEDVVSRAHRAVTGYREPFKREVLSLCDAMARHLVVERHAIRLLEAQIATGGIIDIKSPVRISVQVALKRGMIEAGLARRLEKRETTSYFDPMTGENLNYSELMGRCVLDKDSNLLFLMVEGGTVTPQIRPFEPEPELMRIREKAAAKLTTEVVETKKRSRKKRSSKSSATSVSSTEMSSSTPSSPPAILSRRVVIVDPNTGDEISVHEALKQKLIDKQTANQLLAQEGDFVEEE